MFPNETICTIKFSDLIWDAYRILDFGLPILILLNLDVFAEGVEPGTFSQMSMLLAGIGNALINLCQMKCWDSLVSC